LIFIAHQHAECNIVMAFLSVGPVPVLSKWKDVSSNFLTLWCGHNSIFLNPANVTKFQVEPPQRGRYTGGILQIETLVSETVRDRPIVKYYGTLIGSHR